MKAKIRLRIIHQVPIIGGIMPGVKTKEAFAEVTVQVARLISCLVLAQDKGTGFDVLLTEGRGLPHEPLYRSCMVLRQHGRYRVPFGTKVKEGEIIFLLPHPARVMVDGAEFVL